MHEGIRLTGFLTLHVIFDKKVNGYGEGCYPYSLPYNHVNNDVNGNVQ